MRPPPGVSIQILKISNAVECGAHCIIGTRRHQEKMSPNFSFYHLLSLAYAKFHFLLFEPKLKFPPVTHPATLCYVCCNGYRLLDRTCLCACYACNGRIPQMLDEDLNLGL